MSPRATRREFVAGVSLAAVGGLAGCGGMLGDDTATPTPRSYDNLTERSVFVADALSLSVPEAVTTTDGPGDAHVVVLPASNERTAETAVGWIADGRRVALVGSAAQDTWLGWQDSTAYAEAYPDHRGRASSCAGSSSGGGTPTECEPPELLVAWDPTEGPPRTYGRTWGGTDDPSGAQVFGGIDAAYEE